MNSKEKNATNKVNASSIQGTKKLWLLPHQDEQKSYQISSALGLSLPVSSVLVSRGICDTEMASKFIFSEFDRDVACPTLLKDAQKSVDRMEQAIAKGEKILFFGDYDVDGMTSVAIAMLSLLPLGAQVNYFLPDRVRDGYGISASAVQRAAESGYSLIVTVDNGTTCYAAAQKAQELGLDLIITDHHQPKEALPDTFALVNPHQPDCQYPNKNFCGAGVIFKLMHLMYSQRGLELPEKVYELLMMGTIADMVPLDLENRYWVRRGLSALRSNMSYSFECMARNAGLGPDKSFWSAQDIGFCIAPQLNALGRIDNPRDAVKFLVSSEREVVESVAERLKEINDKRKKIDRAIFAQIDAKIRDGRINLAQERVIMDADDSWPAGVIGLVAGKLCNTYGRPTFLFHLTGQGQAKGSCRSIEQFNVFKALEGTKDILSSFGGHSCAAGLSLDAGNMPQLKRYLEAQVADQVDDYDLQPKIEVDAYLELSDVGHNMLSGLRMLEPFGSSNPVPCFMVKDVVLVRRPELLKDQHVKCLIFSQGVIKPVIFFSRPELEKMFLSNEDRPFDLVVTVNAREWEGRTSVDFIGLDVRFRPS